jgi:hypothetical protein
MKFTRIFFIATLLCVPLTALAQKTAEKPYTKWSQDEAMKVISSKPFADQYVSEKMSNVLGVVDNARGQADNRLGGQDRGSMGRTLTAPPVVLRLHSATPVRQAMVRLRQLQAGYDKMSSDDQKKFDAGQTTLLDCAICKDYYVITMVKFKDSSPGAVNLGLFQNMKLEDFKGKIWLQNDQGERREVEQFTAAKAGGDMSIFFFKRLDDKGSPLFTPESKTIKVIFDNYLREQAADGYLLPPNFEFQVSKIIVNGKVEF